MQFPAAHPNGASHFHHRAWTAPGGCRCGGRWLVPQVRYNYRPLLAPRCSVLGRRGKNPATSCYPRPLAFFCSNALIALTRSLRKCVLAVLITVSEANAVTGFQFRGACNWDTIPQRKGKTATKKQTKNTSKQKKHKTQNQNKAQNNTRNKTSRSGMKYTNAALRRNDQAAYVPCPEQVILEATAKSRTITR